MFPPVYILKCKYFVFQVAGSKFKIPVHVVSFNCDCSNSVKFLKQFAKASRGK